MGATQMRLRAVAPRSVSGVNSSWDTGGGPPRRGRWPVARSRVHAAGRHPRVDRVRGHPRTGAPASISEYLTRMCASQADRSGGEHCTAQEVSEVLARSTVHGKARVRKVDAPAAGSASLLLKFATVLGHCNAGRFRGQEINLTTYDLARINMFPYDVTFESFSIALGDTLTDPQHRDDEPFEALVSTPPYSIRWAGDADPLLIHGERFAPAGVLAPKSKPDLAFTMHILSWLVVDGTAPTVRHPGHHAPPHRGLGHVDREARPHPTSRPLSNHRDQRRETHPRPRTSTRDPRAARPTHQQSRNHVARVRRAGRRALAGPVRHAGDPPRPPPGAVRRPDRARSPARRRPT
ncbi:N-6 DNA methylase [Georgenia sp. Z1491]|uniref:N-6 DNA methylase n=1 Tax=Georgenia sp. Z1491 TaxID=3416707 RepID=UPI003CE70FD8